MSQVALSAQNGLVIHLPEKVLMRFANRRKYSIDSGANPISMPYFRGIKGFICTSGIPDGIAEE
jgi:hypothetical protein